jgi:hypothetical protein
MSSEALLRGSVFYLRKQLPPLVNASYGGVPWDFVYIDGRFEEPFSFLAPPL